MTRILAKGSTAVALMLGLAACEQDYHLAHPEDCRGWRDVWNHEHLVVTNNQKWCSFIWARTYGAGNDPIRRGQAVSLPEHGVLRVTERPEKTFYDYKPVVGYNGPDTFTIAPGGSGAPGGGGRT